MRPDIFESIGLQNSNSKLIDNSVLLDWRTKHPIYRTSRLFEMTDNILKVQQDKNIPQYGEAFDYYFPFNSDNSEKIKGKYTAFRTFLKYSLSRPRDMITILKILKMNFEKKLKGYRRCFL